jgi:hypothetical protein
LSMLAKVLECTGDLTGAGILLGRAYNIFGDLVSAVGTPVVVSIEYA